MDRNELAAALKQEQAERVQACAALLGDVLKEYGCELAAVPGLTADGRIVAQVIVRAK